MGTLRRLQREVIKSQCYKENGNKKAFKDRWEKLHYGVEEVENEESTVAKAKKVKNTEKTKKHHFDDGRAYVKHLKAWKSVIDNMKNKTNAKEKVC